MSINAGDPFFRKLFDPSEKIPDFNIDDITQKALCFRENLIVSLKDELTKDTKPIGGYCISVENIGTDGHEFMVQVLSTLTVNDVFAGTKVLCSATGKFHCLEEKRTEYIHRQDGLYEKIMHIGLEDDLYHLELQDLCPCDKSSWQKDLPICSTREMISEGVNVLLMRYLALKNFHGNLSFQSIMIGGQLITCNYRCSERKYSKLNGYNIEVYTIERKMHEKCGLVHNVKTYMTRDGHILRHDWLEVPYMLQIHSLLDRNKLNSKDCGIIAPLSFQWNSDVQMMSMYLDKKTCKMAQQAEYLTDHPEIQQMISDYVQKLLAGNHPATKAAFLPSFLRQMSRYKSRRVCSICGICFECFMAEQPLLSPESNQDATNSLRYHIPDQDSLISSLCSVFSKCSSDTTCIKKLSRSSDLTVTCKREVKKCSICSLYPDCDKTCDGCQAVQEPCTVHKVCPECPGCHRVCSEIEVCPNCKKCNIEIFPAVPGNSCRKT